MQTFQGTVRFLHLSRGKIWPLTKNRTGIKGHTHTCEHPGSSVREQVVQKIRKGSTCCNDHCHCLHFDCKFHVND